MLSSAAIGASALSLSMFSLTGGLSLTRGPDSVQTACTDVLSDIRARSSPCYVNLRSMQQAGYPFETIRKMQQHLHDTKPDQCPRPCDAVDDNLAQVDSKDGVVNPSAKRQSQTSAMNKTLGVKGTVNPTTDAHARSGVAKSGAHMKDIVDPNTKVQATTSATKKTADVKGIVNPSAEAQAISSAPKKAAHMKGVVDPNTKMKATTRATKKNAHVQGLAVTREKQGEISNPCTDPSWPFAAVIAGSFYCFPTSTSAAKADNGDVVPCGSWCRLSAADGDLGCASVIECQNAAATPAPTASSLPFSLKGSKVIQNNLGHLGPMITGASLAETPPVIRYTGIGGGNVDLVIANLSAYHSNKPSRNGMTEDGNYGLLHFSCGSKVSLRFGFEDSVTHEAVRLMRFRFTLADLDQGILGRCKETVQVMGYKDYFLSDTSELVVGQRQGARIFSASTHGHEDDNPTALSMTSQQDNRAVEFVFEDCQSFSVTVSLEGKRGYGGRNILFAGHTEE